MIFYFIIKQLCIFLILVFTLGIKILIISFLIFSCIFSSVSKSSCCVETTIASIRTGFYCHHIQVLPGFLHQDAGILSVYFPCAMQPVPVIIYEQDPSASGI